jgi:L-cysteine/cystine lyase
MVPAPVYDLGVDAYACSGQKWLCGPDGTGALFVRRDRLAEISQSYIGSAGVQGGMSSHEGYYIPPPAASRYEAATLYPPSVVGLNASLDWLADDIGWEWIYARIAELGRYCYDALAAIPGVTMVSPRAEGGPDALLPGRDRPRRSHRAVGRAADHDPPHPPPERESRLDRLLQY